MLPMCKRQQAWRLLDVDGPPAVLQVGVEAQLQRGAVGHGAPERGVRRRQQPLQVLRYQLRHLLCRGVGAAGLVLRQEGQKCVLHVQQQRQR